MAHGPEREALTAAVKALQEYKSAVLAGVLQGAAIDPEAASRCEAALATFGSRRAADRPAGPPGVRAATASHPR